MLCHFVAHAVGRLAPFVVFEVAALAWRRLRVAFPLAFAVVLMPEHLHLLAAVADPDAARRRLGAVLSGVARSAAYHGPLPLWAHVPPPEEIPNAKHLRRLVRYVALNPCRPPALCADPLSWLWSTHRDATGAVVDPWVCASRLADALGVRVSGFEAAHHLYVSGDPCVRVEGTPAPAPVAPTDTPAVPLEAIAVAAATALRVPLAPIMTRPAARRLFVQLARHQGWRDARLVGRRCGLEPVQVRYLLRQPAAGLAASALCLGDQRLVAWTHVPQYRREAMIRAGMPGHVVQDHRLATF
jgi:hypothetical protein